MLALNRHSPFFGLKAVSVRPRSALAATGLVAALLAGTSAGAAVVFPSTPTLEQFAIVSVGGGASLMINSGPITGAVLAGDGSSVSTAGGGNGSITGGAFADTPALLNAFNSLQTPPATTLVVSTETANAFTEASTLQTFLNGLTATQTFGQLNSTQTITGNGGVNVINFTSARTLCSRSPAAPTTSSSCAPPGT
jgi:hypothetical protein